MSSVVELTPDNFDNPQKLKNSDPTNKGITIVKYYSPNCIHCINSQPAYEEVAKTLSTDKTFKIAQLDCSKHSDFSEQIGRMLTGFEIKGYPTYIIFVNTLFLQPYNDSRDALRMIEVLSEIRDGLGLLK